MWSLQQLTVNRINIVTIPIHTYCVSSCFCLWTVLWSELNLSYRHVHRTFLSFPTPRSHTVRVYKTHHVQKSHVMWYLHTAIILDRELLASQISTMAALIHNGLDNSDFYCIVRDMCTTNVFMMNSKSLTKYFNRSSVIKVFAIGMINTLNLLGLGIRLANGYALDNALFDIDPTGLGASFTRIKRY